jgi:hypothetical protein
MNYKQAFTLTVVKSRKTSQSENLKGSDHFEDEGVDGRMILKFI